MKKTNLLICQLKKGLLPISKLKKLFYLFPNWKSYFTNLEKLSYLEYVVPFAGENHHTPGISNPSVYKSQKIYIWENNHHRIFDWSLFKSQEIHDIYYGQYHVKFIYHHDQIIKSINWYIRNINISIILSSGILDLSVLVLVQETYKTEKIHMMQSTIQILLKIEKR